MENADWPAERQAEWAEQLRTEEENLRVAIRWFLTNDITPLPHIFRILWLFWQMQGRMPEGRAWIEGAAQGRRIGRPRPSGVAVHIGRDCRRSWRRRDALAAVEGLERLQGRVDDPYLESAAHLAVSWILPIEDDFDGALQAALTALDGFGRQNEPFMAFAALTVGMVEMALGPDEDARAHLTEVNQLGGQFDNSWLESTARTQLVSLAVTAGQLDEARALLVKSVEAGEETS